MGIAGDTQLLAELILFHQIGDNPATAAVQDPGVPQVLCNSIAGLEKDKSPLLIFWSLFISMVLFLSRCEEATVLALVSWIACSKLHLSGFLTHCSEVKSGWTTQNIF